MENLEYRLKCAQPLIEDLIGSHQMGPDFATQYAMDHLCLPPETESALVEYAKECEVQLMRIIKNN